MLGFTYILSGLILLLGAYIVFHRFVRQDYLQKGGLTLFSSALQLGIFVALMCFPYLYNPPGWVYFWKLELTSESYNKLIGFILIILGFLSAFGIMFWFGIRRAFGFAMNGLIKSGPYRLSRNPQILGGYLLVIGVALQWPSWYAFGWVVLYGAIIHMMLLTEEEYLRVKYGNIYERYCEEVPRYLLDYRRFLDTST
jgi:protein-S-isoprenylcysteine O-methyltransferase Ste14